MPDAMDQQQCDDIVCARGGHHACRPPKHDERCALNDRNPPPLCTCGVGPISAEVSEG